MHPGVAEMCIAPAGSSAAKCPLAAGQDKWLRQDRLLHPASLQASFCGLEEC
jgi:hypothetical protein